MRRIVACIATIFVPVVALVVSVLARARDERRKRGTIRVNGKEEPRQF